MDLNIGKTLKYPTIKNSTFNFLKISKNFFLHNDTIISNKRKKQKMIKKKFLLGSKVFPRKMVNFKDLNKKFWIKHAFDIIYYVIKFKSKLKRSLASHKICYLSKYHYSLINDLSDSKKNFNNQNIIMKKEVVNYLNKIFFNTQKSNLSYKIKNKSKL